MFFMKKLHKVSFSYYFIFEKNERSAGLVNDKDYEKNFLQGLKTNLPKALPCLEVFMTADSVHKKKKKKKKKN